MKKNKNKNIPENQSIIRESNRLIEAKYRLNMWESRIFLAALSRVKPQDEGFKKYKIYIKDFEKEFGLGGDKDIYARIRKAAQSMRKKEIRIPYQYEEGVGYLVTGLLTSYGGIEGGSGAFIMAELHPDLKPYLLQLKEQFTQYNIAFLMKMRSGHSRRIYRLLKQYENIGKRELTIPHIKELLCIEKGEYSRYSNFKNRIILGAQKDLKKYTDLEFTFDEIKRGRKVCSIVFHIYENSVNVDPLTNLGMAEGIVTSPVQQGELFNECYPKVSEWVSGESLSRWIFTYPKSQIQSGIDYTLGRLKEGEKIENIGGYLLAMIRQKDVVDKAKEEKKKKVTERKEKKKREEVAKQRARLEGLVSRLRSELTGKEALIIEAIFVEDPDAKPRIVDQVKSARFVNFDSKKSDEENLKNPIAAAAFRNAVIKCFSERFEKLQDRYNTKIEKAKEAISRL